jgi:hypothetical protein
MDQEEESNGYKTKQGDVIVNIGIDELEGGAEQYGIGFGAQQDQDDENREMFVVDEENNGIDEGGEDTMAEEDMPQKTDKDLTMNVDEEFQSFG